MRRQAQRSPAQWPTPANTRGRRPRGTTPRRLPSAAGSRLWAAEPAPWVAGGGPGCGPGLRIAPAWWAAWWGWWCRQRRQPGGDQAAENPGCCGGRRGARACFGACVACLWARRSELERRRERALFRGGGGGQLGRVVRPEISGLRSDLHDAPPSSPVMLLVSTKVTHAGSAPLAARLVRGQASH